MAYLQVVCWVCTLVTLVSSSHFWGGMMWWRPVNPTSTTDTRVEIIQRFAWKKYSAGHRDYCDQSLIATGNKFIGDTGQLTCRSGCSGDIANMQTYCADFGDDWSAGERSQIYNPGSVRVFEASYASTNWRTLNVRESNGNWEFRVRFNLNLRSDTGRINTSPVFNMPTVVKVQQSCPTTITIPVKDIDGDDVRCRWASSSRGECGSVCQTFTSPSTLRDCAITYSANTLSAGWYAVAIQIEDFASPSSTVAMSSVPLQFLVEVVQSSQSCSSRPTLVVPPTTPNGQCIFVPFGTTWTSTIVAMSRSLGAGSISNITTASPRGLVQRSDFRQSSQQYYVDVSWTATRDRRGPHVFCYYAEDSNGISSDLSCITLIADDHIQGPQPVPGLVSPPPLSYIPSNQAEWILQFDREFVQPSSSAYIRIFLCEQGFGKRDQEVISIDASSSNVTHLSDKLTFYTDYDFEVGKTYYVLLDQGVAVVTDPMCTSPSPAMTSTTAWTFIVHETRLFQLKLKVGRISVIEDCTTWTSDKASEIKSVIHKELLQAILSRCKYKLPETNIQDGVFSCRDSKDQITYRSTIVGVQSYNATTLVECIQDWVSSKPTITIQWYTVDVDYTCPVGISSISDPECGIDPRTRICIARCNPN